jgi:hypothetical protein
MLPDPPDYIASDPLALTAWRFIYVVTMAKGALWYAADETMLGTLAKLAATHCRRECCYPPGHPKEAAELAALRLVTREMMAGFYLISDARVPLGVLRPDGLDADIARLCGLPEV